MEIKNCRSCGRLYNYMGGPNMCTRCLEKLEEKFQEVKAYLRENPNAPIEEVAETMEVSVKQIKQWIREERLSLANPELGDITCEHCGKPICSGRFCDKCKVTMQNKFYGAISKPEASEAKKRERDGNKMRFLQ